MTYDPTLKCLVDDAVARTQKRLIAAGLTGIQAVLSPLKSVDEVRVTFQRKGSKKEKPVCLFTAMVRKDNIIVTPKQIAAGWFGLIALTAERTAR